MTNFLSRLFRKCFEDNVSKAERDIFRDLAYDEADLMPEGMRREYLDFLRKREETEK